MRLAYEGFNILFADYEKAILDLMIADPLKGWGSREMHKAVRAQGIDISRASVIIYLNFLVDEGIAGVEGATARKRKRAYWIPRTEDDVKKLIMIKIVDGLGEALDVDLDWITERWIS